MHHLTQTKLTNLFMLKNKNIFLMISAVWNLLFWLDSRLLESLIWRDSRLLESIILA
jgi:hypothetical protein